MRACHDKQREHAAQDHGDKPAHIRVERLHARRNPACNDIAHRAQHRQGCHAGHQSGDQRLCKKFNGLRRNSVRYRLHIRHKPHRQDDGDNRRRIAGIVNGNEKQPDRLPALLRCAHHADKIGMKQHAADHHCQVRIALEFLCRRICQQNGQEIECRVRHKIDNLIRGR